MRTARCPALLLASAAILLGGCEKRPQGKTLRLATALPRSHPTGAALLVFRDRLETLTRRSMTIRIAYAGEEGSAGEIFAKCRSGELDMAHVPVGPLAGPLPAVAALGLPFIWEDAGHQHRALDGEAGQIIRQEVRAGGLDILGFLDAGPRSLTTRKGPIVRPDDLDSLRIGVTDSPMGVATIEALGARAGPVEFRGVRDALSAGTLDGWEHNATTVMSVRTSDVGCRHFARTEHASPPDVLIAGADFLAALTELERGWVEQAARETVLRQREMWQAAERESLRRLADSGVTLSDVDHPAFRERTQAVGARAYATGGERFRKVVDQIRRAATATAPATQTSPGG